MIRSSATCIAILVGCLAAVSWTTESIAQVCPGAVGAAGRFVDCGDGTVSDRTTGLVWMRDPVCYPFGDWETNNGLAAAMADGLCGLTDGSSPGDWRLLTQDEWQLILDQVALNGCSEAPFFPDSEGSGCCSSGECPFPALTTVEGIDDQLKFWSSTTHPDNPIRAFVAKLKDGTGKFDNKDSRHFVWAVRAPVTLPAANPIGVAMLAVLLAAAALWQIRRSIRPS